jgi:hypothetical protein
MDSDNRFSKGPSPLQALLSRRFTVNFSLTYGRIALGLLVLLLTAYGSWEAYWYHQIGLAFIKWHTRLVFTSVSGALISLSLALFLKVSTQVSKERIAYVVWLVPSVLTGTEVLLLISGVACTYTENRLGYYQSPYEQNMGNFYGTRGPNTDHYLQGPEFSYPRTTNSWGHVDKEWSVEKDVSTFRIITLGDSFTEGDGSPADSCYPRLLENRLTRLGYRVEVLNAGICGSDPIFGYRNLIDRLITLRPDLVVQTVSSDDMLFDIPLRGGMERFVNDSMLQLKSAPKWEFIVAASHTWRLLLKPFGLDINNPQGGIDNESHVSAMRKLLQDLINKQDSLGVNRGFHTVWAVLPMKHEARSNSFVFPFDVSGWKMLNLTGTSVSNLLECYSSYALTSGRPSNELYWVIDGHHNSNGYSQMAECVSAHILEHRLIPDTFRQHAEQ